MTLALLVALLVFSSYGVASAAGAALVAALWRSSGRLERVTGARGARLLFALRAYPPVFGAIAALVVVAPAFVENEPRGGEGGEIGPGLVLVALAGFLPLALGLVRGLRSLAATRRVERGLRAQARRLTLPEARLPASRIEHAFPVAALYGFFRPRLYVAESVLGSFTPGELRATCAHERAHAVSHDNVKSLLLRASPDWLSLLPLGGTIERAWAQAAEQAADDAAVSGDPGRRVDLASALVKVARLVPPGMRLADSPASFLSGSFLHGGALSARVTRLLDASSPEEATSSTAWVLAACLAALLAPLAVPHSSRVIYELLERALHLTF